MKKKGTGILLTVFFGPWGLFYYSFLLGLIATVVGIGITILTGGSFGPVVWLVSVLYAAFTDPNRGNGLPVGSTQGPKSNALGAQAGHTPSRPDVG